MHVRYFQNSKIIYSAWHDTRFLQHINLQMQKLNFNQVSTDNDIEAKSSLSLRQMLKSKTWWISVVDLICFHASWLTLKYFINCETTMHDYSDILVMINEMNCFWYIIERNRRRLKDKSIIEEDREKLQIDRSSTLERMTNLFEVIAVKMATKKPSGYIDKRWR